MAEEKKVAPSDPKAALAEKVLARHAVFVERKDETGVCQNHDTPYPPKWPCEEAQLALAVLGRDK